MRKRASMLALAVALTTALGIGASAHAGVECVNYQVTAPIVGTRSGSPCVTLPPLFDFPFSFRNCQGVPPLGVSECVGVDLHLPLP
jgi:hypothetical protein